MKRLIDYILDNVVVKNKKILFFGNGSAAYNYIKDNMWILDKIELFVANDVKSSSYLGKPLIEFEEFVKNNSLKDYYIIIASSYFKEIGAQLEKMGLTELDDFYALNKVYENSDTRLNRIVNGVEVGKYTYGYEKHCVTSTLLKKIGSYCSINESVRIGEVNHPLKFITTHPLLYTTEYEIMAPIEGVPGFLDESDVIDVYKEGVNGQIIIENDVWIGAHAIILPNVTIHNGAVIGAGAVVTKDVPPYAIVVGVPARVIKYRFEQNEIDILQKVKWWEWSEEKIKENIELLKNPNLFFEKHN